MGDNMSYGSGISGPGAPVGQGNPIGPGNPTTLAPPLPGELQPFPGTPYYTGNPGVSYARDNTLGAIGFAVQVVLLTVTVMLCGASFWQQYLRAERTEREIEQLHDEWVSERKASEALLKLVDEFRRSPVRPDGHGTGSVGQSPR